MLDSGVSIVLHLRMTGCLLVTPPDYPEEKHTHQVFHLDDGRQLRFVDPRRFGRFRVFYAGEEDALTGVHAGSVPDGEYKGILEVLVPLLIADDNPRNIRTCYFLV